MYNKNISLRKTLTRLVLCSRKNISGDTTSTFQEVGGVTQPFIIFRPHKIV